MICGAKWDWHGIPFLIANWLNQALGEIFPDYSYRTTSQKSVDYLTELME